MAKGSSNSQQVARPFLKWAGGKGQLLPQLEAHLPKEIRTGGIRRYLEPFIGSGAFFFRVAQSYPVQEFILSDLNHDLILTYQVVQKDVEALIAALSAMERDYLNLSESGREKFYYHVREQFNQKRLNINYDRHAGGEDDLADRVNRAAELIFLNRTGYNGLFRLNSRGEFNVPKGRYTSPRILDAENLRAVACVIRDVRFQYGDFVSVEEWVDHQTLVYLDPPYRPISPTAHFRSYSPIPFDDRQQLRLAEYFRKLDSKGAKLMLSNSDPRNYDPGDDFFERAYAGFHIVRLQARRNINSVPVRRGLLSELLILNY